MKYKVNDKKEINIPDELIENYMKTLELTKEEAIQMYLEDEEIEINEEQEALTKKAKENHVTAHLGARKNVENKKTERVRKENPTKEMIIKEVAKILPQFAQNVKIENVGKIITFSIGEDEFKIDLTQKRKKKQ